MNIVNQSAEMRKDVISVYHDGKQWRYHRRRPNGCGASSNIAWKSADTAMVAAKMVVDGDNGRSTLAVAHA